MKDNKVFLRDPPKDLSFQELFRFIWLQGVGNIRDGQGQPRPWTDASLEDRFYEFGYEIDKRSIQNWLSGKNKPSAKNLHRLARVVSNDDTGFKRLWRDAFTMTNVIRDKPVPAIETPIAPLSANSPDAAIDAIKNPKLPWYLSLGGICLLAIAGLAYILNQPPNILITNLKICDEARFDRKVKACVTNVSHFPDGTSLIFASFNMPNAPEGQAFVRKWYREGQMFRAKDDYVDSTWEDYTWLQNDNGHDHGKYNLRIIVNGRVTTASFLVGQVNEDHEWP